MRKLLNISPSEVSHQVSYDDLTNHAIGRVLKYKNTVHLVRYRYDLTKTEFEAYKKLEKELFQQFELIVGNFKVRHFYVISYDGDWIKEYINDPKPNFENCVLLTDDFDCVKEIFIAALRYEAFPIIIDEQMKISFVPTDHLDIFISFDNVEMVNEVKNISANYILVEWNN